MQNQAATRSRRRPQSSSRWRTCGRRARSRRGSVGWATRRCGWPRATAWSWSAPWPVARPAGDAGVRERLSAARLYVVTGARQDRGDLAPFLEAILSAGTDVVQLREKDAEAGDLLRWAAEFRRAADRHGALFVVNDRPDVALAAGADGVHVGQNDLPVAFVRELVGPRMLIGLSTHD